MKLDLKVKRESVIRAMNKEAFNNVIADGTVVTLMKVNPFDIKREGKVVGISYSIVCKLTTGTKKTIATLPGAILFSSQVLTPDAEGNVDENTAKAFYEVVGEGEDDDLDLSPFTTFTVTKAIPRKEKRPHILAMQGDKNPEKLVFNLRDYVAYDAELEAVNGDFVALKYDNVYASGPKKDVTPVKDILIKI
jgi:hypothetical protein